MPPADGSSPLANPSALAATGAPSALSGFLERNRFLLTFAVLSSLMGTSVGMAQVSASLYAVELGSSKTMLGLIAGSQSIGVLLMSLPIGVLVDRFGPRRPFVAGTLFAGLTYAALPLWPSPSWLLLCTAAISFFMPFRFVSLNTVFLQQLASLGEAKAGWYRGTHMLGMFLVGPALGARCISSLGFAWTYRLISLAFLVTIFVSPIVFGRYARAPEAKRSSSWQALRAQVALLIRDRDLRTVSLIESSTQAVGAFFVFFIVVMAVSAVHLSPARASSLVAAKGSTFILALFVLGGLIKRLGQRRAYLLGFASITIALTLLGLAHDAPQLWLGSLTLGIGLGAVQIATLTRYAQIGARTGYGKVSGLSALVGPSGGMLGSLFGGLLSKWVGLPTTFWIAAVGFALGFLVLALRRRSLLAVASLLVLGGCQVQASTPDKPQTSSALSTEERAAAATITPELLRVPIAKLSSNDLQGRGPSTDGDRAARAYLAEQLRSLGLEPGRGAGGFEQPVELVGVTAKMPPSWSFERAGKTLPLVWWDQYIANSGVQSAHGAIDRAEVVFVGYGIEAPEYGWDDFKGRDLHGKILLFLNSDPDWDPALFAGKTRLYYGRWTYKYESAARHGAAGALIIHTQASAGYPFQVVQSSWGGQVFELPSSGEPTLRARGWLTEDAARALTTFAGKDLNELVTTARSKDFAPVPLGVTTSLAFDNQVEHVSSANVYGVIRGRDARLASEYVVLSAHHDHLGIGKADARGDNVYNGALDNAAGDATVLAIARALRALPQAPRRSILVLFPAAEEQNLLGSKYFAEHPPVDAAHLVADINYDCGNIWGRTRDVSQVGVGKSSLDAVVQRLAAAQSRVVKPDQFPDRGSFYRSDQLSFAKVGVPAVYLKTGTDFIGRSEAWGKEQILAYESQRYHQPSDELTEDWNFDGLVEDAQLGFYIALTIANADQAPTWNAGDEFEAARKQSLAKSPAP